MNLFKRIFGKKEVNPITPTPSRILTPSRFGERLNRIEETRREHATISRPHHSDFDVVEDVILPIVVMETLFDDNNNNEVPIQDTPSNDVEFGGGQFGGGGGGGSWIEETPTVEPSNDSYTSNDDSYTSSDSGSSDF
jgi:hypothetical protein